MELRHFCLIVFAVVLTLTLTCFFFDKESPVERRINSDIERRGLSETALNYILKAPFFEELCYRLHILFFLVLVKKKHQKHIIFWIIILIPTTIWAFNHPYTIKYNSLILIGGVFNGWLVGYFYQKEHWKNKLRAIVAPIIVHSEANFLVITAILAKNCL